MGNVDKCVLEVYITTPYGIYATEEVMDADEDMAEAAQEIFDAECNYNYVVRPYEPWERDAMRRDE